MRPIRQGAILPPTTMEIGDVVPSALGQGETAIVGFCVAGWHAALGAMACFGDATFQRVYE
jgi:hypothetical protein